MKYVGWMYNDDTGASGSAVQDDDENTIAWFENADDAIAYVKMASDLAVAIKRAETAERALADLKTEHAHLASMCAAAVAEGNILRKQIAALAEPDWTESPRLAKWWAVDEDGTARWYWSEPTMGKHGWFVRGNSAHLVATSQLAGHVELNGRDWWETLRRNPQSRR